MATRERAEKGRRVRKWAAAGMGVLRAAAFAGVVLCMGAEADADYIQVVNTTNPDYPVASFPAVLDANYASGTTPGYDASVDHELDTSISPYDYNFVTFQDLDGHDVDYNFAPEPEIGDTYTFLLGFENGGGNFYGLENSLRLADFNVNNSNGVTDYEWSLLVDTSGMGEDYNFSRSGLLSEVWASDDKTFAEWEQTLPLAMDWKDGETYGTLTLTAIGVPEPSTAGLLVGAGLAVGALRRRRKRRQD